ncbi:MAG: circularly permuted type 2 ATP-grasp protein, partial [Rubrivivax sp.]
PPAGGMRLRVVAFDIARGPEGRWWVVAQRTQGPSGLGYVLHNRLLVASQFPEAFRELRVQHLASSYRRLLDALERPARILAGGEPPRLALLTPGPYSETWFEQAYLARYLGLTLVEGGDLTVRGEQLFLKTIQGLERIHGLLRRVDDDWCDPLELRADSALGVPGLLQVVRAGQVAMANALGSALLESPAIQGFLPGIAERLLGEPLRLPSLPTWWCGEAAAWEDVREQLDDKLLRSTFPQGGRTSQVFDRAQAGIEADPEAWTVQGRLTFSRAPLWSDGAMMVRPAMVRCYAVAGAQGGWALMPGAMTRVARSGEGSVSMQRGGTSLDTWVLTDGPVDRYTMLPGRLSVDEVRARRGPVGSRTGENLFWLGRYTERTEQQVRLAQVVLPLGSGDGPAQAAVLRAASQLAVRIGLVPPGTPTLAQAPRVFERALSAAAGEESGAWSIAFNLAALERASQALRERLSPAHWGLIRTMREGVRQALQAGPGALAGAAQLLAALDALSLQLAALAGQQADRMTRDAGWRLLTIGRLIERLVGMSQALQDFLAQGALEQGPGQGLDPLLEFFDSTITFRSRYQRRADLLAVVDLLVLDDTNPRALAGLLRRLRSEVPKLPGAAAPLLADWPTPGTGLELEALRGLDDAAIAECVQALAAQWEARALALAEAIGHRHFALAEGPEQVQQA